MSKALTISVSPDSAVRLASRLGVSKARVRRIFAILKKKAQKRSSAHVNFARSSKGRSVKAASRISHSGRRTNGKSAKTAR